MVWLRPVRFTDALFLLSWKNDPATRKNSIVTEDEIRFSDHLKWLKKRLKSPGFYIIMDDNKMCGDIRFDIGDEIEVSIRMSPLFRGKGIATKALKLGMQLHPNNLVAKIVWGNLPSYNLFTSAGFIPYALVEENGKKVTVLKKV